MNMACKKYKSMNGANSREQLKQEEAWVIEVLRVNPGPS